MHNITKRDQLKKLALALGLSGTFFLNACTSNAPSNQTIVTSTDDYEANLATNESESFMKQNLRLLTEKHFTELMMTTSLLRAGLQMLTALWATARMAIF